MAKLHLLIKINLKWLKFYGMAIYLFKPRIGVKFANLFMRAIRLCYFICLAALIVSASTSCDPQRKLLKSRNSALKLTKADEFYAAGKWVRAAELYEDVIRVYRATPEAEEIYFKTAMAHYNAKNYITSGFEFRQFVENYPISDKVEEAYFYYAQSQYMQSSDVDLDQQNTQAAIVSYQIFLDHFPNTKYVDEVNGKIDELRLRLQNKARNNALLYFKIRNYRAAVVAIKNYLEDYPSTPDREYLEWLIVKSYYEYARASVETKKIERFYSTVQSSLEFDERYSHSKFTEDVGKLRQTSLQAIAEISKTTKKNN